MEYPINNYSLFPNCNKIYDKNTNSFDQASSIDIAVCCINDCKQTYEICKRHCNKNIECKNKCINNNNLCKDICSLASSELRINNDFYTCSGKSGCNEINTFPDLKCVNENIKQIDKCVKNKWIPMDPNPKKYSDFFNTLPFTPIQQRKIVSKKEEPTNNVKDNTLEEPTNNVKDNTLIYILFGIIFIYLFFFVF